MLPLIADASKALTNALVKQDEPTKGRFQIRVQVPRGRLVTRDGQLAMGAGFFLGGVLGWA